MCAQHVLFRPCCAGCGLCQALLLARPPTRFPGAGEYSAERLKELKKNTMRYAAPRPSEPAGGVFKLSGSFKPAGAPAAGASFAATAVLQVLVYSGLQLDGQATKRKTCLHLKNQHTYCMCGCLNHTFHLWSSHITSPCRSSPGAPDLLHARIFQVPPADEVELPAPPRPSPVRAAADAKPAAGGSAAVAQPGKAGAVAGAAIAAAAAALDDDDDDGFQIPTEDTIRWSACIAVLT